MGEADCFGFFRPHLWVMAIRKTGIPIIGTFGNITCYMWHGINVVRAKSSLTGKRVKKDKRFGNTRKHAEYLKQASQIASVVYQALPVYFRQYWMFRAFTGEAILLLKAGKNTVEAREELWRVYVREHEERSVRAEVRGKTNNAGNKQSVHRDSFAEVRDMRPGIRKLVVAFKIPSALMPARRARSSEKARAPTYLRCLNSK